MEIAVAERTLATSHQVDKRDPLELTVLGMCFELALTNLLRGPAVSVLMRAIVPTYCGESGSTAGSERATRAYGIGPSGSGIVPIGLAVGATGFLRERSGRTPTRSVHRAIIRSFFLFSVSPFLLGRVKR